ncbi:MAG: chemotaxis-specific protein-glutamate methyltransferase CheB [Deltaproteobacteria bacterium]|nr:chemotaxis-specific protein-glutamate methyltransferase CheB [Deltaproteobacteria bacterium]
MIRALLVDDSALAIMLLSRMLRKAGDIEVVGAARDGREALGLIERLDPSVVCTDLHMPGMDGLELTREIMERHPRPILVVSVSVVEGSANVFKLLEAGAVDVFTKPRGGDEAEFMRLADELISRVRIIAGVHVFKKLKDAGLAPRTPVAPRVNAALKHNHRIVAIGASTGGPQALAMILRALPQTFPMPVVCVQHIGEGFLTGLVEWLQSQCAVAVKVAAEGEGPAPGTVYFPPEGRHLILDDAGRFGCSNEEPVNGHRPSITVTFRSIAARYGPSATGILLTGMGDDGAEGLRLIMDAGGATIAQDEATSVVFGMPKQAIALGAAQDVLPIEGIAAALAASA